MTLAGQCLRKVSGKPVEVLRFVPLTAAGHPDKRSLPKSYHRSLSPQAETDEAASSIAIGDAANNSGAVG